MYSLIMVLPLLSTCMMALGGSFLGERGSNYLAVGHLLMTWILSLFLFWETQIQQCTLLIANNYWIPLSWGGFLWGCLFDSLTSSMVLVVCSISLLVHMYSISYMSGDPHSPSFMAYLSFFTFFMLILVTSHNLLQMFVGWEGVGLCSYLLMGFWYSRLEANKSAIKAMIVNSVGDLGLLLGMFLLWWHYGTVQYSVLKGLWMLNNTQLWVEMCILFILMGAMGKSAQLGLHTWLPDAMEGPTPVSALMHAATMVTAGVFLLISLSSLLEMGTWSLALMAWMGSFTALFAGTIGMFQQDLKKVMAYSTCSQLGYMVAACGLSLYSVSLFHLSTHAFFKALLFLGAGAMIHALQDEQDFSSMGSLWQSLPMSYMSLSIGSLALVGFPFFAGYYSKDLLLELAFGVFWKQEMYVMLCMAALCTAFYSFSLMWHSFWNYSKLNQKLWNYSYEDSWMLLFPLICLMLGSLMAGYFFQPYQLGPVFITPLSSLVKLMPLCGMLGVSMLGCMWFSKSLKTLPSPYAKSLFSFFNQAWLFNSIYNSLITFPILKLSHFMAYKLLDSGLFEWMGPSGVYYYIINRAQYFSQWQSGYLFHYTLIMALGLIFLYLLLMVPLWL